MTQKNLDTGKVRNMRAPQGMLAPPSSMLPECELMFVTLTKAHKGKKTISVTHPKTKESIEVAIPAKAKPGQRIAVPIPRENQTVADVAKAQEKHNRGLSAGAKAAIGVTAVAGAGAAVVGGVILGDHLAGGTLAEDIADGAVDVAEDIADFAVDAGEAIADWDGWDAIGDYAEDVGDWLGDAAEDAGDWVVSLFD